MRATLYACLAAVTVAGCAPAGPWRRPKAVQTQEILDRLAARLDDTRTVRAAGRVSVTQGGARFDAEHRMFFQRPAKYRIEVESKPLLGLFEASAVALAHGESLLVYSPSHGLLLGVSGESDLGLLGPELRWAALPGGREVLLGLPDLDGRNPLESTARAGTDGVYEIPLGVSQGTQVLWVDAKTLSIQRMEIRDEMGTVIAASSYDYDANDPGRPRRVRVKCPGSDAVILLTYSEFSVNEEIDPSVFVLDVPANVRRFRPGS